MQHVFCERLKSPVGELAIVTDEGGFLRAVDWTDREDLNEPPEPSAAAVALARYFQGDCRAIERLQIQMEGTAFQQSVWLALREIPAGETISYGELARRLGRPSAVRAVGMANGANPVSIVVPCHRVIGADGSLTGYGGGLPRKRWLIEHERRQSFLPFLNS